MLTSKDGSQATGRYHVMRAVRGMISHGWPKAVSEELKPFWVRRLDLSVDEGCFIWTNTPESLKNDLLQLLRMNITWE